MAHASTAPAGKSSFGRIGTHLAVLFFVAVWTLPTLGILVTSIRDKDQIIASGWWTAFTSSSQTEAGRLPSPKEAVGRDGKFVLEGNLFEQPGSRTITAFGVRAQAPNQYPAGTTADLGDGETLLINEDGGFVMAYQAAQDGDRGRRIYYSATVPPRFTSENYETVLFSEGIGRSFINSLTVTIPATIIPIMIAAFSAGL